MTEMNRVGSERPDRSVERRRRRRRLLRWAITLLILGLVGGGVWAYRLLTDSDRLIALIQKGTPRYFPSAQLLLDRVKLSPFGGAVEIERARIRQPEQRHDRTMPSWESTLEVAWLKIKQQRKALLHGRFQPVEVFIGQPRLVLRRRADATWNWQSLLAQPWPDPPPQSLPRVVLHDGTVRWSDLATSIGGVLLRDVELGLEPENLPDGRRRFRIVKAEARGDLFERLDLHGWFDPESKAFRIQGKVIGFQISDTLADRLPPELAHWIETTGLSSGQLDITLDHITNIDPTSNPASPALEPADWDYLVRVRVRKGRLETSNGRLPFPIDDITATLVIQPGLVEVLAMEGTHGRTRIRNLTGVFDPQTMDQGACHLDVEVQDLQIDEALIAWAPDDLTQLAVSNGLGGRLDLHARIEHQPGQPPKIDLEADCRDIHLAPVSLHPYRFDQVNGHVHWDGKTLRFHDLRFLIGRSNPGVSDTSVDLQWNGIEGTTLSNDPAPRAIQGDIALINGRPARLNGRIEDPGLDARAQLELQIESLPIDQTFRQALPPQVRKVVERFDPSGQVWVFSTITREPPTPIEPEGRWRIYAVAQFREDGDCRIVYDGFPYPLINLTGSLLIEPGRWEFHDMNARNGQAEISGHGQVWVAPPPGPREPVQFPADASRTRIEMKDAMVQDDSELAVHLNVSAQDLPFNRTLYQAMDPTWQATWDTINPEGGASVDVTIDAGRVPVARTAITIRPVENTRMRLKLPPLPGAESNRTREPVVLPPMNEVKGTFTFINGIVEVIDADFRFWDAPVRIPRGWMQIEDGGRFNLVVDDLSLKDLRVDGELLHRLPASVANFARRIAGQKIPRIWTDLKIAWDGRSGVPATCQWAEGKIVLADNTVDLGLELDQIQGAISDLQGVFDGESIAMSGAVELDFLQVLGQPVLHFSTPLVIRDGRAELNDIRATLLGGTLRGGASTSLESPPRYALNLELGQADLEEFTRTIPGRQALNGTLSAQLELQGIGENIRDLQGGGWATIVDGELGELPPLANIFRLPNFNPIEFREPDDAAFDSAQMRFHVQDGRTEVEQVQLSGRALSLEGAGTYDVLGNLDLLLTILPGRRPWSSITPIGPLFKGASRELIQFRIHGPFAGLTYDPIFLPRSRALFNLGARSNESEVLR